MAYEPLTEEQYNKALSSGLTHNQIIQFEQQRKKDESKIDTSVESKSPIEKQNIIGQTFNVPGATSRAAIQSNSAMAAAGPLAGILALSGVGGQKTQQAASKGASNPSDVKSFQNQALDSYYKKVGNGLLQTIGGFGISAGGLVADMATDPTSVLMSIIPGLIPGKVSTTASVIDKPFLKAVAPGTRGVKKYSDIEKIKNNARSAVESIVDNKNNLELSDISGNVSKGKLPENLDEFSQSILQTKKQIFNQYDAMLKNAGEEGATVPLRPIADEILTAVSHPHIEDLSPTVQNYGLQLADRLQKRGTYTLTEAQDTIEALNNKLKTYFSNPTPEGLHQAVIDRAVVNNLRKSLVDTVESKVGEGYDVLRRQYGKLNAIEESVSKAALKNSGSNSSGLTKMFDTFSSGDIVNGILSMNPAMVAKGGFQVAARKAFSALNNPNNIIKNMFSNVDRIKNIDPQKRQILNVLSKLVPSSTISSISRLNQNGNAEETGNIVDNLSGTNNSEAATLNINKNVDYNDVNKDLKNKIQNLNDKLDKEGITIKVVSGYRDQKEQDRLYAQGRTSPGKIVTNAKHSNHNDGNAVDIVIIKNGKVSNNPEDYKRAGEIGKSLGLGWGGDFKKLKDYGHFEIKIPKKSN